MKKVLVFFLFFFPFGCFAQLSITDSLLKIKATADSNIKNHPAERIFIQTDKLYYAKGDTLWFKAWVFDAPSLGLSAKSGIMYTDIYNDSTTFVQQFRFQVKNGLAWGNISLKDVPAGNYTIRAYTNWMRNFGTDGFYIKQFLVADDKRQTWLANSNTNTTIENNQLKANVKLQLNDMDKKPIAYKVLKVEVMAQNRQLYKQKVQTDKDGELDMNFIVPEKAKRITMAASDEETGSEIVFPVNLNRPQDADVQFLPEGGNLVAGLPARIGFKAVGENGKGIAITGVILDHELKKITSFTTLHQGMGSFDMQVQAGENYTAKVNLPGGFVKDFPLPKVKSSGTVFNTINPFDKDFLIVSASATSDLAQSGKSFFLVGKARGVVCYAAVLNFHNGNIRRNISKRLFPSGITHFILMDTKGDPLNERLVFIDHKDELQVEIKTSKPSYAPHELVAVNIAVSDTSGSAVTGNFALAVTDETYVKQDALNDENIVTHMLLSGDLKGEVEQPGYYLQSKNKQSWQALDNLLLTQGWVNYEWQADKQHPAFAAEDEFAVKGQVKNAFNQAVKGTHVTLLSKSPLFARDTVTDKDGHFVFRDFQQIDTPSFIIKAVNRHEKSFNVVIKMDDSMAPPFVVSTNQTYQPWYINSDTSLLNSAKNNRVRFEAPYIVNSGHLLKEVNITAKKIVKDSQNLNGPGNADMVLDEKDMIKAGKKNWLDLLQQNIKGFHTGNIKSYLMRFFIQDKFMSDIGTAYMNSYPGQNFPWYFINDKPVKFIVDGIPFGVDIKIADWGIPNINDITSYLQSHNAEDIKGIEVNSSIKYAGSYAIRYIPADWPPSINLTPWRIAINSSDYSFIEITTRSGKGPVLTPNTPGIYLYKPMPLSQPAQFYKPKYNINDTTKHPRDLRSTIDWEPNVTTNKNGKAMISFYTADKPGTYILIIEGTDGIGNLGYKTCRIKVNEPK